MEGLGQLLNTIRLVQNNLNKKLKIAGVVMTMYDSRLKLSKQVVDEIQGYFKEKLFKTHIHRNVRLSEALALKPALLYDANSTGAQNHMTLLRKYYIVSENRLGKGLEAHPSKFDKKDKVPKKKSNSKDIISKISLNSIVPNPNQPRLDFNESSIIQLQASIKEKGIITPITVREADKGYELVAGERRFRAAKNLKLRKIPAHIVKVKSESEMMEMALIENIQRENLNPFEESQALLVLNQKYGLTHKEILSQLVKAEYLFQMHCDYSNYLLRYLKVFASRK